MGENSAQQSCQLTNKRYGCGFPFFKGKISWFYFQEEIDLLKWSTTLDSPDYLEPLFCGCQKPEIIIRPNRQQCECMNTHNHTISNGKSSASSTNLRSSCCLFPTFAIKEKKTLILPKLQGFLPVFETVEILEEVRNAAHYFLINFARKSSEFLFGNYHHWSWSRGWIFPLLKMMALHYTFTGVTGVNN